MYFPGYSLCYGCDAEMHFLCDGPDFCDCLCLEQDATPSDLELVDGS